MDKVWGSAPDSRLELILSFLLACIDEITAIECNLISYICKVPYEQLSPFLVVFLLSQKIAFWKPKTEICLSRFNIGNILFFSYLI